MSTEENKAIFRGVMEEAFSQANIAALDRFMSPDFIEHEAEPSLSKISNLQPAIVGEVNV